MTIRRQLQVLFLVAMLGIGVLGVAFYSIDERLELEIEHHRIASQIVQNVFELNILIDDYQIHHEGRALRQWEMLDASSTNLVLLARQSFEDLRRRQLVDRIRYQQADIRRSFFRMAASLEMQRRGEAVAADVLPSLLSSQIFQMSHLMVSAGNRLMSISRVIMASAQSRMRRLSLAVLAATAALGCAVLVWGQRGIVRPLTKLKAATEVLGSGDLTSRTDIRSRDEIGSLSAAFDAMADDIQQRSTALQASEARLRAVIDATIDGIVVIDEHGRIQSTNPAVSKIFGYTSAELDGVNVKVLAPQPHRSEHDSYLSNYLRTGEKKIIGRSREVDGRRKDGTAFPVALSVSEVRLDGRPVFVGVLRDLTEQKRARAERERLAGQLRQSQKMEIVGQLAGSVAHDFNNLLTAILMNAEMLLREDPATSSNEIMFDRVREIITASNSAAALTRQLLVFSRQQVTNPTPLDLSQVVGESETLLRRLLPENIEFDVAGVSLPRSPTPEICKVHADAIQMEQVVLNLVLNARDALPEGGTVRLEVAAVNVDEAQASAHPGARPGPHAMIAVSDNGVGMSAEVRQRIFEPFFTTKQEGKGTGLGLSVVHDIVTGMDGHVVVESEPGRGSAFRVYLPRVEGRVAPATKAATKTSVAGGSEVILVCEDQGQLRRVQAQVLRAAGYTVLEAENGRHALEVAAGHGGEIDLLVTDVAMPELNGHQLEEALTSLQPGLRTIFVSGYAPELGGRLAAGQRLPSFLQKPFSLKALLRRVRAVLDDELVA